MEAKCKHETYRGVCSAHVVEGEFCPSHAFSLQADASKGCIYGILIDGEYKQCGIYSYKGGYCEDHLRYGYFPSADETCQMILVTFNGLKKCSIPATRGQYCKSHYTALHDDPGLVRKQARLAERWK